MYKNVEYLFNNCLIYFTNFTYTFSIKLKSVPQTNPKTVK